MSSTEVFFDLSIDHVPAGRMIFSLYSNELPLTTNNFKCLCTGEKGIGKRGKLLSYKGSLFHRVIKGFMAQGGDFTHGSGIGGESIYGNTFPDENFTYKHTKRGQLSMANAGPDTNGSQFFLTFRATPHLDGKHVVFGELIQGLVLLDRIEKILTRSEDRPKFDIIIENCGIVTDNDLIPPDPVEEMNSLPTSFGNKEKKSWTSKHTAIVAPAEVSRAERENKLKFEQVKTLLEKNQSEENEKEEEVVDALPSNPTPQQRKLFELKLKLNEAKRANAREVGDERKKFTDPNFKKKEAYKEKESEKADVAKTESETKTDSKQYAHMNQTAEQSQKEYLKKIRDGKLEFRQEIGDHYTFEKASKNVPLSGNHIIQNSGIVDTNSLNHGHNSVIPPRNIDLLAKEVNDLAEKRINERKRKQVWGDANVTSINDSNRMFNQKLEKSLGKYTAGIKAALERGSA